MAGWLLPGCCARAHGRRRPSGFFVACGRRLCRVGRACRPSAGLLTGAGRLLSDFPTLGMPPCRRCRMVLRHGPFQGAKRAVPECGTALFARLFGPAAQVAVAQMVGGGAQKGVPMVKNATLWMRLPVPCASFRAGKPVARRRPRPRSTPAARQTTCWWQAVRPR